MKLLSRSFAGGEITPELAGRLDLDKYQTGLALARNFVTLPHGPVARRSGFEFINEAKDSTQTVRLMPFSFSATQTAVLEFGHTYIRFHIGGGTLLESSQAITSIVGSVVTMGAAHGYATGDWVYIGTRYHKITVTSPATYTTSDLWGVATTAAGATSARVYTLATSYAAADLFELNFTQSADVITIVHPSYPARELKRLGAAEWTLTDISFAPSSDVPTNVAATPTVAVSTNLTQTKYVVTAVQPDGVTESLASASASASNNLTLAGNFNTITWAGVDGSDRYNVYKLRGGIYGYIGQVTPTPGVAKAISSSTPYQDAGFFKYRRVRIITGAAHGFSTGDRTLVEGTTYFDGLHQITVEDATTFTYAKTTQLKVPTTGGTVSIPVLSLTDDNVLADTTQSPPQDIITLNSSPSDYPAAAVYHEQRRWFAGTAERPQVLWATRTGTENNLTSSLPTRDADGMELRIASSQYNQVRHLVALSDLVALTAGGEFRIYAEGSSAITPTSVTIKPQGYSGASNVQPVVTSGSILFVQAQGSRVRELAYGGESANYGYRSIDVSIMAPHRFNGFTLTQLAYARAPEPTLWAVRSDGTLLGMTYLPEQKVYGWHAHDTVGKFESVCVVAEGNEDVLYAVARRHINGRFVRYVERLRTRMLTDAKDAFFVDSGLSYVGAPVTAIVGLHHLEGETVDILADGAVAPRQQVVNGSITLQTAASKVHVGLNIVADMRTLPLVVDGAPASGQGTIKNINKVYLRVSQSSLVKAGPSFDRLREYPARAVTDNYGSPPGLRDGELALSIDPSWNQDGALCVRQDLPLPLTVLSMTLDVQAGG